MCPPVCWVLHHFSTDRKCRPFLCIYKTPLARGNLRRVDFAGRKNGGNLHCSNENNSKSTLDISLLKASASLLWRCFTAASTPRSGHSTSSPAPHSASPLLSPFHPCPLKLTPGNIINFHLMFGRATSFSPAQIRVHLRLSKSIKVLRRKKKKKVCFSR